MSRPRHVRRKRRHIMPFFLLAILLVGAIYAGAHCLFRAPDLPAPQEDSPQTESGDSQAQTQQEKDPAEQAANALQSHRARKPDCYTILISGLDDDNGGADTNMLVTVNVGEGFVHAVSIPRDTKCIYDGKSHKINAAYNSGGMERLSSVISDQLGIPVDYTVTLDLKGFVALVDAIGGVDFEIPVNMNYDDPTQNLSIHFKKGMQHLDGKSAIKVVRFRHNNDGTGYGSEDIGRMQTQQNFWRPWQRKCSLSPTFPRCPSWRRFSSPM